MNPQNSLAPAGSTDNPLPAPSSASLNSPPPTLNLPSPAPDALPLPRSHGPRSPTGKVARLPKALRDQLNQLLLDGVPVKEIIARLGEPARALNKANVSHWKAGAGFKDWLKEQQLLEQSRLRYELTLDLARQIQGIDSFNATHKLAAAQICETLAEIGPDALRASLAASPLNYFRMLNALTRLTAGGLKCERHLSDEADRLARLQPQELPAPKKGLTPATLHQMEDALKLL